MGILSFIDLCPHFYPSFGIFLVDGDSLYDVGLEVYHEEVLEGIY